MFNEIKAAFDLATYDAENDKSIIQGWAMDPVTKSPVEIECSIPAYINTTFRGDINNLFGIDRDTEYGFFIQFPGDLNKLRPKFTFRTRDLVEDSTEAVTEKKNTFKKVTRLFEILREEEVLPKALQEYLDSKEEEERTFTPREEREQPLDPFYDWMTDYEEGEFTDLEEIKDLKIPKVSFILTQKKNSKKGIDDLKRTIETIQNQLIGEPEILIATQNELEEPFGQEFKVYQDQSLAQAINQAAKEAQGDYLTFIDAGDEVSNHFLSEVTASVNKEDADFIYADSDKIDKEGNRYDLQFKPDYDEIELRTHNYILQPVIVKKELFNKIGGIRPDREGLQQYDLVLRATKEAEKINHLPKILYHWYQTHKKPALDSEHMKEYELGTVILNERFPEEEYVLSDTDYYFDLKTKPNEDQKIAIITGIGKDFNSKRLNETVESILANNNDDNLELIVLNSDKKFNNERVKQIEDDSVVSYKEIYNRGAKETDADLLVFIKPGFTAVEMCWLKELQTMINIDNIGLVSPYFYSNHYQIREAGVKVEEGKRKNIGLGAYCQSKGFNGSLRAPREVFGISSNCLIIPRELFEELDGFDETLLDEEADLDLSIRARELGKKSVVHNNIPAHLQDYIETENIYLKNLNDRYDEETLGFTLENPNLQPGSSAYKFKPLGV